MLAVAIHFIAGRYHATPWDRHVNEGAVAWPPEPWRILRALVATWHHKVRHSERHSEATLSGLIASLSRDLPEYHLPTASHSHTRHYMPQFGTGDTKLVFDAFASVKRDDPLTVTWPQVELPEEQLALLDDLLAVMGYLGRAESWVEAQRIDDPQSSANCTPGDEPLDKATGELKGELVTVYASLPDEQYQSVRDGFLTDARAVRKLSSTLPETLLDALSVPTSDLRKQGWNQPPAARKVRYLRPVDALRPVRVVRKSFLRSATTVRFLVIGKPLPRVEDSLRIGELLRLAVMGRARMLFGEDCIPAVFSGHGMPEGNRHGHAFYLPWDSDDDGRIDRLLIHVPDAMTGDQRRAVEKLNRIWSRDGNEWRLVLEGIGGSEIGMPLLKPSTNWASVTPYLHPWHAKPRFAAIDQIRRELRERGFPEPTAIERLEQVAAGPGRLRSPIHFHRFRARRGLTQPDRHGSFWKLRFATAVEGPLALGFACHFGLGLFRPADP